jgi:hypothetical protein
MSVTEENMEFEKDETHMSAYKITAEEIVIVPLDVDLWNMLHLLFHALIVPLSFEVLVETKQPKLLKTGTVFNSLRDCS